MLKLQIHNDTVERIAKELDRAGAREIGGVLVGEHVERNTFRIVDVSVQRHGGNHVCFVRRPEAHKPFLDAFFARTGDAYERFNYLGEWHSHPSFAAIPSVTDIEQMAEIVDSDPSAPPFAVLLIVRLNTDGKLGCSATAFRPGRPGETIELTVTTRPQDDPARPVGLWKQLFGRPTGKPRIRLI